VGALRCDYDPHPETRGCSEQISAREGSSSSDTEHFLCRPLLALHADVRHGRVALELPDRCFGVLRSEFGCALDGVRRTIDLARKIVCDFLLEALLGELSAHLFAHGFGPRQGFLGPRPSELGFIVC